MGLSFAKINQPPRASMFIDPSFPRQSIALHINFACQLAIHSAAETGALRDDASVVAALLATFVAICAVQLSVYWRLIAKEADANHDVALSPPSLVDAFFRDAFVALPYVIRLRPTRPFLERIHWTKESPETSPRRTLVALRDYMSDTRVELTSIFAMFALGILAFGRQLPGFAAVLDTFTPIKVTILWLATCLLVSLIAVSLTRLFSRR
jgi:hypothetical protein